MNRSLQGEQGGRGIAEETAYTKAGKHEDSMRGPARSGWLGHCVNREGWRKEAGKSGKPNFPNLADHAEELWFLIAQLDMDFSCIFWTF